MNVSKFMSKVIGLYMIIISTAMLMNMNQFTVDIQGLMGNVSLMLYIGCVTVIMGLMMVVSHNIWQWSWRLFVTITAWIVLLKGASIILFPHALDQVTAQFVSNMQLAYSIAVMDFCLGVLMCYFGFRKSR